MTPDIPKPAAKSPSFATQIPPAIQPKTSQATKAIRHPDGPVLSVVGIDGLDVFVDL